MPTQDIYADALNLGNFGNFGIFRVPGARLRTRRTASKPSRLPAAHQDVGRPASVQAVIPPGTVIT